MGMTPSMMSDVDTGSADTVDYSASALQLGYASNYWGVVNSRGSIDHGASGSGIFNANNLLVGSSSRAGVGQCPANPPPVPTKDTQVALFNRFASTFCLRMVGLQTLLEIIRSLRRL